MEIYALARFGRWQELARKDAPPEAWRYSTGVWHFGRGLAHAARNHAEAAQRELSTLSGIAAEPALAEAPFASGSTPAQLLAIAVRVLGARIASEAARWDEAIPLLREAVALQDALPYTEPPPWYFPTREALGETLLRSGQPAQAEAVYRGQLVHTPRNGWSLHGLAASLRAQDKTDAAIAAEAQLDEVWRRADVSLESSVF